MGIRHKTIKDKGEKGYHHEWNEDHVIDGDVDFVQHMLLNMVVHSGSEFPSSPVAGQLFYRSDLNTLYIYTGAEWLAVQAVGGNFLRYIYHDSSEATSKQYTIPGGTLGSELIVLFNVRVYGYHKLYGGNLSSQTGYGRILINGSEKYRVQTKELKGMNWLNPSTGIEGHYDFSACDAITACYRSTDLDFSSDITVKVEVWESHSGAVYDAACRNNLFLILGR